MRCWVKYFVLAVFLDFMYLEASNQLCWSEKINTRKVDIFCHNSKGQYSMKTHWFPVWIYKINVYVSVKRFLYIKLHCFWNLFFCELWCGVKFLFLNKNHFPNYLSFIIIFSHYLNYLFYLPLSSLCRCI